MFSDVITLYVRVLGRPNPHRGGRVNGEVGDCLLGLCISGESLLAEEPPMALREVDRSNRNSEKPANAGGRVLEGHTRAEEISSRIQRLPYPAGRGLVTARPMQPMKLIMMSDIAQNSSNGVNRAPCTQTRGSAPGRGKGRKATQVDTKRNPCDIVLSCAEKTYIGTS